MNSECCDAPLEHFENDLGLCSSCKEWSVPIEQDDEEELNDVA